MKNYLFVFLLLALSFSACTKTNYEDNPPQLEISVFDLQSQPVSNVNVSLFLSLSDWENQQNSIVSASTDADGKILFENLQEKSYWFLAKKGELTNQFSPARFEEALKVNVKTKISTVIK